MAGKTTRNGAASAQPITGEAPVQSIGERLILKLPTMASHLLPSRGQVAVEADLNGHAFMTVLEPDGMKGHWISIDGHLQQTLELRDGDTVTFTLTPTKDWPEPALPEDFRTALRTAPDTEEPWDDITPMARWEWVRWVNATKNATTRERRIEASISKLLSGHRRPCCFDLSSCTDPEVSKSGKLIDLA